MTTGSEIQIEKGYFARVHNAIFEQLAKTDLTSYEFRCLMFLFRKTYGHQKKEDEISLSQWVEGTGIEKRNLAKTLAGLVEKRIICKIGGERGRGKTATWGFNKYIEQWQSTEKVCGDTPIKKVSTDTPFAEKKVYVDTPEKVYVDTPTKERKKVAAAATALHPFIESYQRIWALMPESEYRTQVIGEWAQRVTLQAWEYALKECADNRKVGQWRYLESILRRVEREGVPALNGAGPPAKTPEPTVISVPR